MKAIKRHFYLVLALALLPAAALPAEADRNNGTWYVGGGLGISQVKSLCPHGSFTDCDDTGGVLRVFGGLKLNPYFALEASLDLSGDYQSPGATEAGYDGSVGAYLLGVNAIGFLPLGQRVSLYGGASGAFSYVVTDVTPRRYHDGTYSTCYYDGYNYYGDWYYYCTNHSYDDRDYRSDTSVAAGALVGIDVAVARRVHVRAQAQRYFNVRGDVGFNGHRDLDLFTVNGLFMF